MDRAFAKYFRPRGQERIEQQREEQAELLRDAQKAAPFIERYKSRLHKRAAEKKWQNGMTQEQAAQNLIAQTIYLEMIEELDRMLRAATE